MRRGLLSEYSIFKNATIFLYIRHSHPEEKGKFKVFVKTLTNK